VNPIFYHLFSRKYRLACMRTMQRIIHCKRHRHPSNKNIHQKDKSPFIQPDSNQIRKAKIIETIYRSPTRIKVNGQMGRNRTYLTRLSLPAYIPKQIQ
jgi:hypothetical protein